MSPPQDSKKRETGAEQSSMPGRAEPHRGAGGGGEDRHRDQMPCHTGAQQGHPRAQGEQREIPVKKCELRLPENPRDLVSRDPNPPGQARTQRVSIRPQSPPQTTRSLVCRGGREGLTACPCSQARGC